MGEVLSSTFVGSMSTIGATEVAANTYLNDRAQGANGLTTPRSRRPNPGYWVPKGYAVVLVDPPGWAPLASTLRTPPAVYGHVCPDVSRAPWPPWAPFSATQGRLMVVTMVVEPPGTAAGAAPGSRKRPLTCNFFCRADRI